MTEGEKFISDSRALEALGIDVEKSTAIADATELVQEEIEDQDDHCWTWRKSADYPFIPSLTL